MTQRQIKVDATNRKTASRELVPRFLFRHFFFEEQ
jgi:hypothetical protein